MPQEIKIVSDFALMVLGFYFVYQTLKDLHFSKKQSIVTVVLFAIFLLHHQTLVIYSLSYKEIFIPFSLSAATLFAYVRYGKYFRIKYMILFGFVLGVIAGLDMIGFLAMIPIVIISLLSRGLKVNIPALILIVMVFLSIQLIFSFMMIDHSISFVNFSESVNGFINSKLDLRQYHLLISYPGLIIVILFLLAYVNKTLTSVGLFVLPVMLFLATLNSSVFPGIVYAIPFLAIGFANIFKTFNNLKWNKTLRNSMRNLVVLIVVVLTFIIGFISMNIRFLDTRAPLEFIVYPD